MLLSLSAVVLLGAFVLLLWRYASLRPWHAVVCALHASTCPKQQDSGPVFREPKGKRVVPLPPELVPILRAHRAGQLRERMAAGIAWEDHDLVFCRPDAARPTRATASRNGRRCWPLPGRAPARQAPHVGDFAARTGRGRPGRDGNPRPLEAFASRSATRAWRRRSPIRRARLMGRALWGHDRNRPCDRKRPRASR